MPEPSKPCKASWRAARAALCVFAFCAKKSTKARRQRSTEAPLPFSASCASWGKLGTCASASKASAAGGSDRSRRIMSKVPCRWLTELETSLARLKASL